MDHLMLRERLAPELPEGLLAHIDRVVALAGELAERHGLDVPRTLLAAQGHDVLRHLPPDELLRRAEARGMRIDALERAEPVLLHGPLGALELRNRFGIVDEVVTDAVRWHTTGDPDYPPEAWAMFVADKVDPAKVERWPALQRVADLARESLEEAAIAYLDLRLDEGVTKGWPILPMAVAARNALVMRRGDTRHVEPG